MKGTHEREPAVNGVDHAAERRNGEFPAGRPALGDEAERSGSVRIPPWAFVRAMAAVAWSAFRHPFTTTVIDLSTGKVVREA